MEDNSYRKPSVMMKSIDLRITKIVEDLDGFFLKKIFDTIAIILTKYFMVVIPFMIFALFVNGGFVIDQIIIVLYIVCIPYTMLVSRNTILLYAAVMHYKNPQAFYNTLKASNYLIPGLRRCEKEKNKFVQNKMYLDLIREMDARYGEGNHMIGLPLNEEVIKKKEVEKQRLRAEENWRQEQEREKERERRTKEIFEELARKEKEGEQIAYKDIKELTYYVLNDFNKFVDMMKGYKRGITSDYACEEKFKEFNKLFARQNLSHNELYAPWKIHTGIGIQKGYTKTIQYWLGTFHIPRDRKEYEERKLGLFNLLLLRSGKLLRRSVNTKNEYYKLDDITCLEGKLTYEFIQGIKDMPGDIDIEFNDIDKDTYDLLCMAVSQHQYTYKDLLKEYDSVYYKQEVYKYDWFRGI